MDANELAQVTQIANRLLDYLNQPEVQQAIAIANQPGQSSSLVQSSFVEFADRTGLSTGSKRFICQFLYERVVT